MSSIEVESHGIQTLADFGVILGQLLDHAESVKPTASIEPALDRSDFGDVQSQLATVFPKLQSDSPQSQRERQFEIVDNAVRDVFNKLVKNTTIDSPAFVKVWNLLDLLSVLSDMEQCDAGLLFRLVETLLDSQTISGCRRIFDYLESRRQRITSKHFKNKQLAILRSCNELLRRLSRARDTTFCGRVFIFMFQSFPLGDKSSVNLRGEYHTENVTTFDTSIPSQDGSTDKMDVDGQANGTKEVTKPTSTDSSKSEAKSLDMDALYPVFWSLQASFSQPKRLFDAAHFAKFKSGLEATLAAFAEAHRKQSARPAKSAEEPKAGQKRKREDGERDMADSFNPKYLTSRDLFELELSDLTFRRHILVQALIIMDFLLSLSAEAKEKLPDIKLLNRSVTYPDQSLSKEDTDWVNKIKASIISDLKNPSLDGAYFHRMVDTVLARDKNWVRWKVDSCPSIQLPPMSPDLFVEAQKSARRVATSKRLRTTPMSAISIEFLDDGDETSALGKFKSTDRYRLPELNTFKKKIQEDDLEILFPTNNQTKTAAIEGKSSKTWRALRIASRNRLALFDKIDEPEKVDIIFNENSTLQSTESSNGGPPGKKPADTRPLIISGPTGVGKSSLVKLLMEKNPGVFGEVPTHTTRPPTEGESKGDEYHFVDSSTFNMMLDGDHFLTTSTIDGRQYGVSRRVADSISENGKVPLMQMSVNAAFEAKDMGYSARNVLIKPPELSVFEGRLRDFGIQVENLDETMKGVADAIERSTKEGLYDSIITNDELDAAYTTLERFVYSSEQNGQPYDEGDGMDLKES